MAPATRTPSSSHSASRLQFQTPAFLRRIPMPNISEDAGFVSPRPIRLPRKPLVRGLSSILADLRRTEEEQLDDDLEALREMEGEGEGEGEGVAPAAPARPVDRLDKSSHARPAPAPAPAAGTAPASEPESTPALLPRKARNTQDIDSILAEDSQKQNLSLLGGFDDEGMYDSQDGEREGVDRDGRPLKVYKKKGQKRTTRKANMRPVRTKRPSASGTRQAGGESDDEVVPETQHAAPGPARPDQQEDEDPALLSGSEFAGSEYDDDEDELALDQPKGPKTSTGKSGRKPTAQSTKVKGDDNPEGKVKKVTRKVNELAHANFKRLKLRNSGAKGGPGYNSRFRRRR